MRLCLGPLQQDRGGSLKDSGAQDCWEPKLLKVGMAILGLACVGKQRPRPTWSLLHSFSGTHKDPGLSLPKLALKEEKKSYDLFVRLLDETLI